MQIKKSSIFGTITKIILIVLVAITLILGCFIYLNYQSGHKAYEDKLLLNEFGRQRMFTQMMSKDASRFYSLLQTLDTESSNQRIEQLAEQLSELEGSLIGTQIEFENTLNEIQNGKLTIASHSIQIGGAIVTKSKNLKQLSALWEEFSNQINILTNENSTMMEIEQATVFLNNNNLKLLKLCDKLLEEVLNASIKSGRTVTYIIYILIGLLTVFIVLSFIQLQRRLFLPFLQLYQGISDIGLEKYPNTNHITTDNKMIPIVTEVGDMFKKINKLISLIENINNNNSFMDTLKFISNTFSDFIPYNYIGIALIDEDHKKLTASYGVSDETITGMPERMMGASWLIEDTSMGQLIETGEGRIINDLEAYCEGRPLKLYNSVILDSGIKASITLPLTVSGQPVGMIFFSSSQKEVYTKEHLRFLKTLANSIAISLDQNIFINDIMYSSVLALAKLAETRDEDTGEHLERMAIYTRAIAELLHENDIYSEEISLEYTEQLERFSPLHDIGKVGILDTILLKPGKLTTEEFSEMKKHTTFGGQVLRSSEQYMQKKGKSLFNIGIEIAENHHEKWDGSGYPSGKSGLQIPLSARIVALADVFDALTSKRPYKEAYPFETSLAIIAEGRGTHFDPAIVDVFLNNKKQIEQLYNATGLL